MASIADWLAIEEAEDLAARHAGVVLWNREGDPVVGEEGESEIVFRSGTIGDFD